MPACWQDFDQCGGITNCPFQDCGGPCDDKQYFACASPASACVRINAYYWQCRAKPATAAAPAADLTAQLPLAAAVGSAPAPAPVQAALIMDDGAAHLPGCTEASTDARCLFGRRLLDTNSAAKDMAGSGPVEPSDIIMQAVRRHLAAAEGAPAPSAFPPAEEPVPAPGPSSRMANPVPVAHYGTCGGTGAHLCQLYCLLQHVRRVTGN